MWGIHRGPVNSPHKWPVTRKMFPFHDVIMFWLRMSWVYSWCIWVYPENHIMDASWLAHERNIWGVCFELRKVAYVLCLPFLLAYCMQYGIVLSLITVRLDCHDDCTNWNNPIVTLHFSEEATKTTLRFYYSIYVYINKTWYSIQCCSEFSLRNDTTPYLALTCKLLLWLFTPHYKSTAILRF